MDRLASHGRLADYLPIDRVAAARGVIEAARDSLRAGNVDAVIGEEALAIAAAEVLAERNAESREPALQTRRAINATGVLLHTNLGRSTLASSAVRAVEAVAAGHAALEIDVTSGGRGDRQLACATLLRQLTGAEDALVVNNNAAATFLALHVIASGREVILSRGQMVEIGGQFRLPDVIESAGARLREVGTTNRTRIADYERAVGPDTGMLLRVHPSNFRVVGFTAAASLTQLVALARAVGVPVGDDIGSGALVDLDAYGLSGEPTAPASVAAGADIVWFSGDKLLGGPQAGILVGKHAHIQAMKTHPLSRALRPDKLTLAALEATLRLYTTGRAWSDVPTLRRIARPAEDVLAAGGRVARAIRAADHSLEVDLVATETQIGGGSLPGHTLASWSVAITPARGTVGELAGRLRAAVTPVFGRIEKGRLLLDFRSVDGDEEDAIVAAFDSP